MLGNTEAFSGFAVDDIAAAREFYEAVLGLRVTEQNGMLHLHAAGDGYTLVYPKPDHVPATYTILNFPVDNIEATADALAARGVEFERYEGVDEHGVFRLGGPPIAWFKDPAGNILSIIDLG
jgi:catechol 2,3-dioxygenase-like lactoylglutathione lyase family enzyme